jgi:predicted DNA-binding transcriptional regulator AlpA
MKDLVPLKRVAADLGVSRSTLWRASRSAIPGFPRPLVLRARVYWLRGDLPALKAAMDRFQGRRAFEAERRHAKARAALAQASGLKSKRRKPASTIPQPDLFGAADAAGPGGAERANRGRRY